MASSVDRRHAIPLPPGGGRGRGFSRYLLALAIALATTAALACGPAPSSSDSTPTPNPSGTPADLSQRACPTGAPETYVNFGAPFMENWCTGCHSSHLTGADRKDAPVGVDFDTLGGVRAHADRIYLRAGDGYATMPPVGTVDTSLRIELGDWLACGAP